MRRRVYASVSMILLAAIGCSAEPPPEVAAGSQTQPLPPEASGMKTTKENESMSDMPSPSRPSPPQVEPVVHGGVRYEQDMNSYSHGGTQPGGYLVAMDPATEERLWMLKVYEIPSQDAAGVTTPGRYFRAMRLVPGKDEIEIESEVGGKYLIDLVTRTSTWVSGPDSVHR